MDIALQILERYGPWAIGWGVAFLLWRRNNSLTDIIIGIVKDNNDTNTATQTVLTAIRTRLEMHNG